MKVSVMYEQCWRAASPAI